MYTMGERVEVEDRCCVSRAWPAPPSPDELERALSELTPRTAGGSWQPVEVDGPRSGDQGEGRFYWFRYRRDLGPAQSEPQSRRRADRLIAEVLASTLLVAIRGSRGSG